LNIELWVLTQIRKKEKVSWNWIIKNTKLERENGCCGCCDDCHELTWPNDFMPVITREQRFGLILPGDYEIVGPFIWKPGANDCLLMAVDAKGDRSNVSLIAPGQSLRLKRLVPFDNNIALRCMCKQCNPDYSKLKLKQPCRKPNDTGVGEEGS